LRQFSENLGGRLVATYGASFIPGAETSRADASVHAVLSVLLHLVGSRGQLPRVPAQPPALMFALIELILTRMDAGNIVRRWVLKGVA
jgi:hypothetical protein